MCKFSSVVFVLALCSLACQGCSKQAWYEGLKSRQKQECAQLPTQSEAQRCMENIPGSYDQYNREREQDKQKTP